MTVADVFSPAYTQTIIDTAKSLGLDLQVGSDFKFFRAISKSQPLKSHVNPAFDPAFVDISPLNGFWMIGRDTNGEIVHTQAMKILELSNVSLAEHFRSHLTDYRTHGHKFDVERSNCFLTPAAAEITGRVCYHGELWLKGGPDGYRGGCLTTFLTRLMLAMCLQRWSPDFIIGLQSPSTTCRGLAVREGYMRLEQRSIVWQLADCADIMEDWLVWMSRDEASFNLRVPLEIFYDLFETSSRVNTGNLEQLRKTA